MDLRKIEYLIMGINEILKVDLGNTSDKKEYFIENIIYACIVCAVYKKILPVAQIIIGKYLISGYKLLLILCAFSILIGWCSSVKYERNKISVSIIWLFPVLVYMNLYFWENQNRIYFYLIGTILISNVCLSSICKYLGKTLNDNTHYIIFRRRIHYYIPRLICCLVLGFGALGGYFYTHPQSDEVPEYADWMPYNRVQMEKEDLEKIILFSSWEKLTEEEKKKAICTLSKIENEHLGLQPESEICVGFPEKEHSNTYDPEEDAIYIGNSVYQSIDGYDVIRLYCHQIYHRYQIYQVKLFKQLYNKKSFEDYNKMILFNKAAIYWDEWKTRDEMKYDCEKYKEQNIEIDCELYAQSSEKVYQSVIANYSE